MTPQQKHENSTRLLKAIAHPLRLAIIELLSSHQRMNVTEIFQYLDIEQAVASHHLAILKDRGVLTANRQGKNIYYQLKHTGVKRIAHYVQSSF